MCRITQCCCCCGLRTGTYLAAAYTLTLGLIGAILVGVSGGITTAAKNYINNDPNLSQAQKDGSDWFLTILEIICYIFLAIYLLWCIFAVIMIIGTAKSSRNYLIGWIVMTIIVTIFCGINILISLISIGVIFQNVSTAISFIVQVTIFVVNIYALIGVMSFFKDDCQDREIGGKHVV